LASFLPKYEAIWTSEIKYHFSPRRNGRKEKALANICELSARVHDFSEAGLVA
jgi:hypothetical protein